MEVIEEVRQSKEYKQAKLKGIDVESIIAKAEQSEQYQKYQNPRTRRAILISSIKPDPNEPQGDPFDETLLVLGGSDAYGKSFPVNYVAMRKNGKFITIASFDGDAFPCPCKARVIGVSNDNAYGFSVWASKTGGISEVVELSFDEAQKILVKYSIRPGDKDKIEGISNYSVVLFRGIILNVEGIDVWGPKNAEGKSVKVGYLPVMCEDERNPPRLLPTMKILIDCAGYGCSIEARIEHQRHGHPIINVEDFAAICDDASQMEDKQEQIQYVRAGMADREVLIGMRVFGAGYYNQIKQIRGTLCYMAEINEEIPDTDVREKLQTEGRSEIEEREALGIDQADGHTESPYVESIVSGCLTLNQDPQYVPVQKARTMAEIGEEVSDTMVREILKRSSQVWSERKG